MLVQLHVLYFQFINCREDIGDIIENVGGGLASGDYEEQSRYITPTYLLKPCIPEQ